MISAAQAWIPYCGPGPDPADWADQWNLDPILIGLIIAVLAIGLLRSPATARWQMAAAIIMLMLFVSPLCALGSALFSFRVAHHMILALVLAPILAAATGIFQSRRQFSLALTTTLQVTVFWAWHVPGLYEAALGSHAAFWTMEASITGFSLLWWSALRRASPLAASASLLTTMVQMGLLGALIVFAGRPLYAPHLLTTAAWSLTPIDDQQIAGLLMWVVGGGVNIALVAVLLYRALAPAPALRPA